VSPHRILVVDDSDTARTVLARTLERAGFAVTAARNGAEGAASALREPPSVVVTDLDMPVMDGHQLLRFLKSEAATASTPVVILTSHGEALARFWGSKIGADAYLTKDCEPGDLVATVARLASLTPAPAPTEASLPLGALDVLTRVVRQLDTTLLHATLVNSLLERGLRANDLEAASRVTFEVVRDVADVHLMAVGVTEHDSATLQVLLAHPVSLQSSRRFNDAVLAAMSLPPDVALDVRVTGTPEGSDDVDPANLVSFPLPLRDAAGVLAMLPSEPQQFEVTSRHLIQEIAPHIALVLDNARLGQRLQELSSHDGLTRLLNYRAIHERLGHEIERATRYGRPLTVIICDLDYFKRVNDTYGHKAGDTVLRSVAGAMTRALRGSDALGRYGGEEFIAVLPEIDLEAGRQVAERLRRTVAEHPITLASGTQVPITASFGVASGAEFAAEATADAIVGLADSRLYEAKAAGRNCVRP
jgi:two-component system cell cycle response regulator